VPVYADYALTSPLPTPAPLNAKQTRAVAFGDAAFPLYEQVMSMMVLEFESTIAKEGEAVRSSRSYQKKCRLVKLLQATCHQNVWRAPTDGTALPTVGPE
jgi:hypothetical protein